MKKIFYPLILGFIISSVFSEEMINVSSLSDGGCFFYEGEGGQRVVKVASFNQSLAWTIDEFAIQKAKEQISQTLSLYNYEFKDNKYELYLHCGAYGTSLLFNIDMQGFRVCTWSELSSKGIILRNLAVTHKPGICHGQIPGRLTIYTTSDEGSYLIEKELAGVSWNRMVSYVAAGGFGKVTVFLTTEYTFSEHKVKERLESTFGSEYIKYIEMENLYHPIGEFKAIESLGSN